MSMRIFFADFSHVRICGFAGCAGKWICPRRVEIEFVQAAPVLLNHPWWACRRHSLQSIWRLRRKYQNQIIQIFSDDGCLKYWYINLGGCIIHIHRMNKKGGEKMRGADKKEEDRPSFYRWKLAAKRHRNENSNKSSAYYCKTFRNIQTCLMTK